MSFIIEDVLGLALVQDLGRSGYYDIGVTVGGAMDMEAHQLANQLLGNEETAATLELSLAAVKLKATQTMHLSVCGAESDLLVNGQSQNLWQTFTVTQGDIIEIKVPKKGCRTYLAVAGGLNTPLVFDSRSIVVREKLGGFGGQPLRKGDELSILKPDTKHVSPSIHHKLRQSEIPSYPQEITLRVVQGYQHHWFSEVQKRLFFSSHYEVSQHSDRMGYRLKGPAIECTSYKLVSEGICLGAIQVPADGQPIILMRDRQTIGGYPKIGSVLSIDINRLSQATPGCKINFQSITVEEAHNALHLHEAMSAKRLKSMKTIQK